MVHQPKIEQRPIRLSPHRLRTDDSGRWIITTSSEKQIELPRSYQEYFRRIVDGESIQSILRVQSGVLAETQKFSRLKRFLTFLVDHDLIDDPAVVEFVLNLNPDYSWRESIAFSTLAQIPILRFKMSPTPPMTTQMMLTVVFIICAGLTLLWSFNKVVSGEQNWPALSSPWPVVISLLLVFSLARSCRAFLQTLVFRCFAGAAFHLSLRIDPFGLHLATTDVSKTRANPLFVVMSFLALSGLLVASAFDLTRIGVPFAVTALIPFATQVVLISELCPFRLSALSEVLRALYIEIDSHQDGSERKKDAVAWIQTLHMICSVSWVTALGFFLVFGAADLFLHLGPQLNFSSRPEIWPSLLVVGMFALLTGGFLDDIVSWVGDSAGGDRVSVRRLWARREVGLELGFGNGLSEDEISSLPLLRSFDSSNRQKLLAKSKWLMVPVGKKICRQGDTDRSLYIILDGSCAVTKTLSNGRTQTMAVLSKGAVFGEMAFFFGEPRSATVRALEPSRLVRIKHDADFNDLHRGRSAELQVRVWFLQALAGSRVFRHLPSEAMDALAFSGERKTYRPGEKIISEGEISDGCYFIVQGNASVSQNFRQINQLKAGDSFGEITLLNPGLLRTATVKAETDLIAVKIATEKFGSLLSEHLSLAVILEQVAEERLKNDARLQQTGVG